MIDEQTTLHCIGWMDGWMDEIGMVGFVIFVILMREISGLLAY